MQVQLSIYNVADTVFLADWSTRVISCNVRCNDHGFESCEAELDLPFLEAFTYYQQFGPLKVRVSWGSYRIWEGRLEDPTQFTAQKSGLRITALGAWVAFNDAPYTALWSDRSLDPWKIVTFEDNAMAGLNPERYDMDKNNRLYIALKEGEAIGAGTNFAMWGFQIPHLSSRNITGIQYDWEFTAPVGFQWYLQGRGLNWSTAGSVNILSVNGTGAQLNGSHSFSFAAIPVSSQVAIDFLLYNNTGGTYNVAVPTGTYYLKITNIRVVTSVANMIDTTFTANRNAGVNVTATIGSNARMFVGQKIIVANAAGTVSETVTVLSLTSTNQFNATFVLNYVIGDVVRAQVIYPDEIIKDCVSMISTLNSAQLSAVTSLIQSQAIDLDQEVYEDQYPTEIINHLIDKSDTLARQWVAMCYEDRQLIVRPRGSGTAWYTNVPTLEIVRTLEELANSVYAVYNDPSDRKLRTTTNTDTFSTGQFAITKRRAIEVDTLSSVQAAFVRDTHLNKHKDPVPRANITIKQVMDQYDNPYFLFFVRADDTLTIRNLPPILGATVDKIRTLVITKTDYDVIKNELSIELELPSPRLDILIAQALKG